MTARTQCATTSPYDDFLLVTTVSGKALSKEVALGDVTSESPLHVHPLLDTLASVHPTF